MPSTPAIGNRGNGSSQRPLGRDNRPPSPGSNGCFEKKPHLKGEAILVVADSLSGEGTWWARCGVKPALPGWAALRPWHGSRGRAFWSLGARTERKPVGNGGAVPCGTCKANPPGDVGWEEVWAGEWRRAPGLEGRAHLRLAAPREVLSGISAPAPY